jgi:hypothetical protein
MGLTPRKLRAGKVKGSRPLEVGGEEAGPSRGTPPAGDRQPAAVGGRRAETHEVELGQPSSL